MFNLLQKHFKKLLALFFLFILTYLYTQTSSSINSLKEIATLRTRQLNNTSNSERDVVFFNRIPKVGSQTMMELMKTLSVKNGFKFNMDKTQKIERITLGNDEQKKLANQVNFFTPPSVYVKHVCFINFTKFDLPMPIYINMVREPVERVISWYYYVRAPWYLVERKELFPDVTLPSSNWLRKDYETCVSQNDRECIYIEGEKRYDFVQLTKLFCGHDEDCLRFNTDAALQKAKEVIETHYAVVGVLEEMNKTLIVLEHYIPKFFRGAFEAYWQQPNRFSKINRNIYKPSVSEATKALVRRNFSREIEFYNFCRDRLNRQYMALNLTK